MSVKIRLRRTGRKKQPSYRIVVADSKAPRDGQYLDAVGTYNPLTNPADLRIDMDKVDKWLATGAEMSETAASLIRKARRGGDAKVAVRGVGPEIREPAGDIVSAAEPSTPTTPSRPGSRGAPKAVAAGSADPAEAPVDAAAAPSEAAATAPVEAAAAEPAAAEVPAEAAGTEPADVTAVGTGEPVAADPAVDPDGPAATDPAERAPGTAE
jgi:small subunit ribosomal protein S16